MRFTYISGPNKGTGPAVIIARIPAGIPVPERDEWLRNQGMKFGFGPYPTKRQAILTARFQFGRIPDGRIEYKYIRMEA